MEQCTHLFPESFCRNPARSWPLNSWIPAQKRCGNDQIERFCFAQISLGFVWLKNSANQIFLLEVSTQGVFGRFIEVDSMAWRMLVTAEKNCCK